MARPTFSDMQTEIQRRLGGTNYTGFTTRIQEWIKAKYYDCATCWWHPELDTIDTGKKITTGKSEVGLSTNVFIIMGIALLHPDDSTFIKWLREREFHFLVSNFSKTNAEPAFYTRFGDKLYFNCNAKGDYPLRIYYYRTPAEPDFSGNVDQGSELSKEWDEIIQKWATALGYESTFRPDLARLLDEKVDQMIAKRPNPPLFEDRLKSRSERVRVDESHGGSR